MWVSFPGLSVLFRSVEQIATAIDMLRNHEHLTVQDADSSSATRPPSIAPRHPAAFDTKFSEWMTTVGSGGQNGLKLRPHQLRRGAETHSWSSNQAGRLERGPWNTFRSVAVPL